MEIAIRAFAVIGVIATVLAVLFAAYASSTLLKLWLMARFSQAGISFFELLGMRLRRVDVPTIVISQIRLKKAGVTNVSVRDLEFHALAGGNVGLCATVMIRAHGDGTPGRWGAICAVDLAGRDPFKSLDRGLDLEGDLEHLPRYGDG